MNIVHLVTNKCWGGGERYVLDLARASVDAGHSVAVITRGIPEVDAPFAEAGIALAGLPMRGWWDLYSTLQLARIFNRMGGDTIVHVHNFKDAGTALAARRLSRNPQKTKIVVTRHLARPAKTDRINTDRYRRVDAVIFVSETARRIFMSSSPEIDGARVHVIHNAVREVPPCVPPRPHDEPVILYLGRIAEEKGLDILIAALGMIPDRRWRLKVAGAGVSTEVMPIVRMARGNGVDARTEWMGHVDSTDEVLADADIVVVPTKAPEAFGLVILEAMGAGRAVIASDSGAQAELIDDGVDGVLFRSGDVGDLRDKIVTLLEDRDTRDRLAQKATSAPAEKFAYDDFFKKVEQLYTKLRDNVG